MSAGAVAALCAAAGILFVVLLALTNRAEGKAREAEWRRAALRLGGNLRRRRGRLRMEFRWQGVRAELQETAREWRLSIPWSGLSEIGIRLRGGAPEGRDAPAAISGWSVEGDWSYAARLKTDAFVRVLEEIGKQASVWKQMEISLGPAGLSAKGPPTSNLAAILTRLAQLALQAKAVLGADAGVQVVAVETAAEGACQVCGAALGEEAVRCAKCETRHHADCWEYAGRCSTYGCGGSERM